MKNKTTRTFLFLSFLSILVVLNFSTQNYKYNDNFSLSKKNENNSLNYNAEATPYIVGDSLKCNLITNDTFEYQMEVIGNFANNENMSVTINGDDQPFKTAKRIDTDDNDNIYVYEVENLNYSTDYDFFSLNNTGLAYYSPNNFIDNEIELKNEANIENTSFKTNQNPILTDFWINEDSITTTTITFGITLYNYSDVHLDIEDSINLSLEKKSTGEYKTYNASLISSEGELGKKGEISLTYKIENLEPNTTYKFISLNNTNLAITSGNNPIDNEILIEEELKFNNNEFTTVYSNPFISSGGFKITNTHGTVVEFSLEITDDYNNFNYYNPLKVKLNDKNGEIVTAQFIDKNENKYYYQISGLEENTTYSIYSLIDTNLAIEGNGNVVDEEILIEEELGVLDNNFTTEKMDSIELDGMPVYWFPIIFGIFILIVAVFIGYKVKKNNI
ncbi:MAG: hypothetical protein HPAVJP_3180 [Candidatus Hepatoplasma vulgare]|nr:MAG: hypothetical protein HPAVJP_3180 [Candidatus Hepatoplasma sp.]